MTLYPARRLPYLSISVLYFFTTGLLDCFGCKQIRDRAFDRLVEFGERSVGHAAERHEQTSNAFGVHDERAHVIFGWGVGLEVGNVVADPALLGFVPPNLTARRIPGLAVDDRRRRGCRGRGDSPATTIPSWDKCRGRTGSSVSAALHHGAGFGP